MGLITISQCDQCGLKAEERADGHSPVGWMLLSIPGLSQLMLCSWKCLDAYGAKARKKPPTENTAVEPNARFVNEVTATVSLPENYPDPPPIPDVPANPPESSPPESS